MKLIGIFKNGKCIKTVKSDDVSVSRKFIKCVDTAGGMWNGVDHFYVKLLN